MDTHETRVILFYGLSNAEAVAAMRAVKAALPENQQPAFATVTANNRRWPMEELAEHVWEEHLQMTGRKASETC
jgi:hypothetical protein